MDLRKVFDQTVRDLKREVNKKVLKIPEIEQKVLDATSNEPWGPHGSAMAEIAQATRNFNDYQMIMSILWKRLADTGRNWRHVYKGLTVFDFLVAHGADRVIDELREHVFQIQGLIDFQYVEPNGKDQGVNVRKKAQALVSLLNDKEKIREVRQKAAANRDKYQGYSSTGGIYKPSSYSSTGAKGFSDWDTDRNGYGGREDRFGTFDEDRYGKGGDRNDRYRDHWQEREETTRSFDSNDESDYSSSAANKTTAGSKKTTLPTYEQTQKKNEKPSVPVGALNPPANGQSTTALDDDDFDPRAPAPASRPSASAAPEVDLLQMDFFSTAPEPNVDPFAEPSFQSSSVSKKDGASDPFGSNASSDAFGNDFGAFTSAPSAPTTAGGDFFANDPFNQLTNLQPESKPAAANPAAFNAFESAPASSTTFDPFAPASQTSSFNAFNDVLPPTTTPAAAPSSLESQTSTAQNKQNFQTKSSVWADSLTSGLIDLNITAPKSTSLAELGIQFDNNNNNNSLGNDWSLKGRAMGSGSGLGLAGASGLPAPNTNTGAGFGFNNNSNAGFFSTPATSQHDQFDFGSFK